MLLWEKKVADAQQVFTIRNACFIKYTPASPCRGRPWPQAEDLKPWTKFPSISMDSMMSIRITTFCQQETDAELAAAFFSDNRTVAATLEALDESPEPKIVEKSPSSRAGMIQGNLRSREDRLSMTTDGSGTIFDLSIQEMASIFICTIRKIHDKGRTPLVAVRQAPLLFSILDFEERLGMLEGVNRARNLPHLSRNEHICCPHVAR
ncbi:hypothetical protein E4U50_005647 [Claviceps purpurea]|nr:hypothetical protein E4U50_005647 [Claviceps purpurea]